MTIQHQTHTSQHHGKAGRGKGFLEYIGKEIGEAVGLAAVIELPAKLRDCAVTKVVRAALINRKDKKHVR